MSMFEPGSFNSKLPGGIPNHQVSIVAFGNQTLSALKSDEFCRRAAQPARQVVERETASFALRPNNRQAQLQRRYATPGLHEIATLSQLHRRRAWRIVPNNHIASSVADGAPELFTVIPLANRRTTLEYRVDVRNFFGRHTSRKPRGLRVYFQPRR